MQEKDFQNAKLEERIVDSCSSILYYLDKYGDLPNVIENEKRNLLLRDLAWKISRLPQYEKLETIARAWPQFLSQDLRHQLTLDDLRLYNIESILPHKGKISKNVAIVTARGDELRAVLTAIGACGIDKPQASTRALKLPIYYCDVNNTHGEPLSILITMAGEERNIATAMVVMDLLYDYDVDLFVMVGITAGRQGKVKRGDVIFPYQVYDYEGGRLVPSAMVNKVASRASDTPMNQIVNKPQPEMPRIVKEVRTAWELFRNDGVGDFERSFRGIKRKCKSSEIPVAASKHSFKPSIKPGDIAAGEKLAKDGYFLNSLSDYNENIIGLNEEDYGFSKALTSTNNKWCIFRGVSDYGKPHPNKEWQFVAALSAATACMAFLGTTWPSKRVNNQS